MSADEPVDLVINLYNGYSDGELQKITEHVDHVYRSLPDADREAVRRDIARERWITEIPDLDAAVAAMLAHGGEHKDEILRDAVPEAFWKALAVYVAHASLYSIKWAERFGQEDIDGMIRRCRTAFEDYDGFRICIPKWYAEKTRT